MRHLLRRQEKSINQKLTGSNYTNQQAQPRHHYHISNRNSHIDQCRQCQRGGDANTCF